MTGHFKGFLASRLAIIKGSWTDGELVLGLDSPLRFKQKNMYGEVKVFEDYLVGLMRLNKSVQCRNYADPKYKPLCVDGVYPKRFRSDGLLLL